MGIMLRPTLQQKKGYYFSLDALIALVIILGVVIFIKPQVVQPTYQSYIQEDFIDVLSNVQIGELNNSRARTLRALPPTSISYIEDPNKSVLEQMGQYYADSTNEEIFLTQSILIDLDLDENIALYFDDNTIWIDAAYPISDATNILTSRQILSGIKNASSSKGYSARAFLFSENKVDYFYFGGYVGDGNLTARIVGDVIGARMEGVFSHDFNLRINACDLGTQTVTTPGEPIEIAITGANLSCFASGDNNVSFSSPNNLYIAGGYIRVTYNSSSVSSSLKTKRLPGIDGLINLYDSFYIPGQLEGMNASLHYNSSFDLFFTIGNTTVYTGNSSGAETTITIDNNTFWGAFDYSSMSEKTIPFRLGLVNASYLYNESISADVVSVTDISGSMVCGGDNSLCAPQSSSCCYWNQWWCENRCLDTWLGPINGAKAANVAFIEAVLNDSSLGNRVGLVAYSSNAELANAHDLSTDNISLINEVNSWTQGGGTCICCGINRAKDMLVNQGDPNATYSIIVMSDGAPTVYCSSFSDYTGSGSGGSSDQIDIDWAIEAARNAHDNHGITVHAIGFGLGADQVTLQDIRTAGGGNYYYGNVSDIIDIYEEVAQDVIEASYSEQTITGEGIHTTLFSDSYLSFDYEKNLPMGMIISAETNEFGGSSGTVDLPVNSTPYEVRVISYSGSRWTSRVTVNNSLLGSWTQVFNLGNFGNDFLDLGDPYVVNIPVSQLVIGENDVNVSVGLNPVNNTPGSQYNKIIYSVLKNITSYSPVVANAVGCDWTIELEDSSTIALTIPENYSGGANCYYNNSLGSVNNYVSFNENDAVQYAVYLLLRSLDLNRNGRIEANFDEDELSIIPQNYTGIPFTWSTEVQTRVWI